MMRKEGLAVFALSYIFWLLVTPVVEIWYMLSGAVVCALIAWMFSAYSFEEISSSILDPRRWIYFVRYILILGWGILLAGISLARIILKPNIEIRPGVVVVPTSLEKRWERTLLANSITLTPGTFFLDMNEEEGLLYVHWISMKSESLERIREMITERYERIIAKVFE